MTCKHCGAELADDTLLCSACGAQQESAPEEPVAEPIPEEPVEDPAPEEPVEEPTPEEPVEEPTPEEPVEESAPEEPVEEPTSEEPVEEPVAEPATPSPLICTHCGTVLEEGSAYCLECGAKCEAPVPVIPVIIPPVQIPAAPICSKCGTPIRDGFQFCGRCGTPANAPQPTQPVAAPVYPPSLPRKILPNKRRKKQSVPARSKRVPLWVSGFSFVSSRSCCAWCF